MEWQKHDPFALQIALCNIWFGYPSFVFGNLNYLFSIEIHDKTKPVILTEYDWETQAIEHPNMSIYIV